MRDEGVSLPAGVHLLDVGGMGDIGYELGDVGNKKADVRARSQKVDAR